MLKRHDPTAVFAALSNYTNAIEVSPHARWLFISGQVGVNVLGQTQDGFDAQCRAALSNVAALLGSANMSFGDVVKLTVFLTRVADLAAYRRIRDEVVGARTASSLVVVAGLADPGFLVEIEAVAASATAPFTAG